MGCQSSHHLKDQEACPLITYTSEEGLSAEETDSEHSDVSRINWLDMEDAFEDINPLENHGNNRNSSELRRNSEDANSEGETKDGSQVFQPTGEKTSKIESRSFSALLAQNKNKKDDDQFYEAQEEQTQLRDHRQVDPPQRETVPTLEGLKFIGVLVPEDVTEQDVKRALELIGREKGLGVVLTSGRL